ncbi:hypothetical protein CLAFUW4_04518 [Fulvia fulva]|uniref:Uncharacterized protein n=1 Tax=Passalora fulva TaxID=5499 RepID=A0A9Q8P7Z8_PASFU|nr:uncharacterized protein CLAFUR5_04481 [Fulvia fulva]KAK4627280.1 hypothetical protein CLAFUR4_04504 [Fulvia fulva]KAK4628363.1 hypothetical protein CLAFUR0_04507 [Fulvia fulva]UJO16576.1 hypothetical protein CLAFUR5_04481 [Fulvia fulva]WPV13884.1 hypothetical protein CLAFUW4_04518 [Fulvia fulva]WPV29336.1 hypothetical protein CLAFUW7_04510 [Fulvia fulva]
MSSPQQTLLRFSRFTTSLSEVPLLSRRAQLRGFSATPQVASQTRFSTDNPTTGSTAEHDSVPSQSDSGSGQRDAGEIGLGSHTGMSGSVGDSASGARESDVNSNASNTQNHPGGLRSSPNDNVNEAHSQPSEQAKDTTQTTKQGHQDADPLLKGQDEGPQSINAEKAAAKK